MMITDRDNGKYKKLTDLVEPIHEL